MNTADQPGWYEIRFEGRLDEKWFLWFDGLTLDPQPGGVTLLSGPVTDQAALHGVLARLRDLGLPIISVVRDPGGGAPDR